MVGDGGGRVIWKQVERGRNKGEQGSEGRRGGGGGIVGEGVEEDG